MKYFRITRAQFWNKKSSFSTVCSFANQSIAIIWKMQKTCSLWRLISSIYFKEGKIEILQIRIIIDFSWRTSGSFYSASCSLDFYQCFLNTIVSGNDLVYFTVLYEIQSCNTLFNCPIEMFLFLFINDHIFALKYFFNVKTEIVFDPLRQFFNLKNNLHSLDKLW